MSLSSPSLSPQSIVVASQTQVSSDLQDESVILDVKSGTYYGLNDVVASMWTMVQEPTSVAGSQAAILDECDVTPDECNRDVLTLLHQLIDIGLVCIHAESLH